jgi:uncharacterized protein (DUF2164 family)
MRISLADERRDALLAELQAYCTSALDLELSPFRAQRLLEFFLRELGPAVYNQAIRDAHGFLSRKLEDLEGDLYWPEETPGCDLSPAGGDTGEPPGGSSGDSR